MPTTSGEPVDWTRVGVGDAVRVPGGGSGVIERGPDRRGRVRVRVGAGRLELPAERLTRALPGSERPPAKRDRVRVERADPRADEHLATGGANRCDLRGKRVEEALDLLNAALDQAAAEGRDELEIVHGIGTGALRSAVRECLADSPYVTDLRSGDTETGGEGLTIARLGRG